MPYTISSTPTPEQTYKVHPFTGRVTLYVPDPKDKDAAKTFAHTIRHEVIHAIQDIQAQANPLDGSQALPFFGHTLSIAHDAAPGRVQRFGRIVHVGAEPKDTPAMIRKFYRQACMDEAKKIMAPMVSITERVCTFIEIGDSFSWWGRCTNAKSIELSWRLAMAPIGVLRYVAAHETAHLTHMNHGPKFWALCDALTPHRAMAEEWLNNHGHGLMYHGNHIRIHPFWSKDTLSTPRIRGY